MAVIRPSFSRSAFWVSLEAFGGALFSSVGLLVIASLIGPRDLGLSAIVLGIMQTVNFFPDTLFHDAIIQRNRLSRQHLGSAFWSVVALSLVLGAAVALLAPLTARLYDEPDLLPLLLGVAMSTVPTGIASIQAARLRRAMRFRALAGYAIVSRALATVGGLCLAVAGYGAWAMVAQNALIPVLLVLLFAVTMRWRFARYCSLAHARGIGVFALTRTATHFLEVSRGRLLFIVLGYYLPLEVLGQVNFAFRLIDSITSVLATTIGRLYLPIFSRVQSSTFAVAAAIRESSCITAALLAPPFTVVALIGDDLVQALADSRWQGMGGLISWLCVAGLTSIIETPASTALLAVGRPGLLSATTSGIFAALFIGVFTSAPTTGAQAMACWSVASLVGLPINFGITRYAMGLSVRSQIESLCPAILVTAIIAAVAIAVGHYLYPDRQPIHIAYGILIDGLVYSAVIAGFLGAFFRRKRRFTRGHLLRPAYSKEAL